MDDGVSSAKRTRSAYEADEDSGEDEPSSKRGKVI